MKFVAIKHKNGDGVVSMGKEIVLLCDSITQGLGSKKINFTENLNSLLVDGFHVDNMALTGTTISYAQEILPRIIEKNLIIQ